MGTLLNNVLPMKGKEFSRTNHFIFYRTEIKGNMAWIAYDNIADISVTNWKGSVHWLESAVLIKQEGTWKIQMLHSTRINDERK